MAFIFTAVQNTKNTCWLEFSSLFFLLSITLWQQHQLLYSITRLITSFPFIISIVCIPLYRHIIFFIANGVYLTIKKILAIVFWSCYRTFIVVEIYQFDKSTEWIIEMSLRITHETTTNAKYKHTVCILSAFLGTQSSIHFAIHLFFSYLLLNMRTNIILFVCTKPLQIHFKFGFHTNTTLCSISECKRKKIGFAFFSFMISANNCKKIWWHFFSILLVEFVHVIVRFCVCVCVHGDDALATRKKYTV